MFDIRDHGGNYGRTKKKSKLPKKSFFPALLTPLEPSSGGQPINIGSILGATSKFMVASGGGNALYIISAKPGEKFRMVATINMADSIVATWGGIPIADRYVAFYSLSSSTYYLNVVDLDDPTFKTKYVQGWLQEYVQALSITTSTRCAAPSAVGDYSFITTTRHAIKINNVGEIAWVAQTSASNSNQSIIGEMDGYLYVQNGFYLQKIDVETGVIVKSLPKLLWDAKTSYIITKTKKCLLYTGVNVIVLDFSNPDVGVPTLSTISYTTMCIPDPRDDSAMVLAFSDVTNAPALYRKKVMTYSQNFTTVDNYIEYQSADAVPRELRDTSRQRGSYIAQYLAFGPALDTGSQYEIIPMEE